MKIGDITVGMVMQAQDLYHRVAYAGLAIYKGPDLGDDPSYPVTMFLDRFEDETQSDGQRTIHRYVLRLGNSMYPFMKLVLSEHIVQDEYFFSVDTHDDMFKGVPTAEVEEIARVRSFNLWVKERIETLWAEAGIPTTASLSVVIQQKKLLRRCRPRHRTVLVVDDDRSIGSTIQLVLEAAGFDVERLFDGADAMDVADPERHHLIIMDYQMREMDGLEALARLKASHRTRKIPVIIATTQNLDLARLSQADAFLHKPFHVDVLTSFVNHLLGLREE